MAAAAESPLYAYVDNVNSNLICCICRMPFIEPVVTSNCFHHFCWDCITRAISVNPQCPVDRSPLTPEGLHPASTIVRNLVDELMVECPHRAAGCQYSCQRQLLPSHLSETCEYVQVQCTHASCSHTVLKKDIGKHSEDCVHRLVECEACGRDVKLSDMDAHHNECPATDIICVHCTLTLPRSGLVGHLSTCEFMPIPCPHAGFGCSWSGPRHTLSSTHIDTCPYEAIQGFFTVTNTRFVALETENSDLKRKIEVLEQTVRSHERDLEVARQRLGPWFKPSSGVDSREGEARRALDSLDGNGNTRVERSRRRLSAPLNAAMFGLGGDTTSEGVTMSDLSASFSAMGTNASSSSGENRGFFAPLPQSNGMTPPLYPRSQNSNAFVAPVNLSTSMEGTLNSLRGSVVALAGGLDSLERKHDIMLTTETLRMHEDVASLRAIVHGLRMQVHSLMMDRNPQLTGRVAVMPPNGLAWATTSSLNGLDQSPSNIPTRYTTVSRFPYGLMPGVSLSPSESDTELTAHSGSTDVGVSSAARYLNQDPPAPYRLSPNVTTSTTSTTLRRTMHENKL